MRPIARRKSHRDTRQVRCSLPGTASPPSRAPTTRRIVAPQPWSASQSEGPSPAGDLGSHSRSGLEFEIMTLRLYRRRAFTRGRSSGPVRTPHPERGVEDRARLRRAHVLFLRERTATHSRDWLNLSGATYCLARMFLFTNAGAESGKRASGHLGLPAPRCALTNSSNYFSSDGKPVRMPKTRSAFSSTWSFRRREKPCRGRFDILFHNGRSRQSINGPV